MQLSQMRKKTECNKGKYYFKKPLLQFIYTHIHIYLIYWKKI